MKPSQASTEGRLSRSMNLSIVSGAAGTVWLIVCAPQAVFNVFVRNALGAGSSQLGLLVGILSLASVLQLPAILIYSKLSRRKPFWIITSVIHRLNGFVLAWVAFSVAAGGDKDQAFTVLFAAMVASWVITNVSSSGWWSWMADLIPLAVRARFFGRRSAVSQVVNIVAFFVTTVVLDAAVGRELYIIYGIVFLVGGIGGVVDILLHVLIPEGRPSAEGSDTDADRDRPDGDVPVTGASAFFEPLRTRNFLVFALVTGMVLFSINVAAPFLAPYVTDPATVGAPNTWLGIMFVISQLTWITMSPRWGTVMDRFGRKPVVLIGVLFTISWIGYLFLTPGNYVIILPIIALVGGLLAPAFWDGINQLMLSLTPEHNRLTFIAWYWTIIGVVSAGGSIVGGLLDDALRGASISIGPFRPTGFHAVVVASLVLVGLSFLALSRVQEGSVKRTSYVFSRIANPGIFRTFLNIGVLARPDDSSRVLRALRSIDSSSDDLAVSEILERASDPDPDVRDEAIRALGRLRSIEAVDGLQSILNDPASPNRVAAARALGRIGDVRAIPLLVDAMEGASEELREACAVAIGDIGGDASVQFLLTLIRADESEVVAAGSAAAVARHGIFEAAWEIVPRLKSTANPVLRTQLAIALANVLGRPGEFYRYVTGAADSRTRQVRRLIGDALKGGKRLAQRVGAGTPRPDGPFSDLFAAGVDAAAERWDSCLDRLFGFADELLRAIVPGAGSSRVLLEAVYEVDPRLGLWYWFLQQRQGETGEERLRLHTLVALYYLETQSRRDDEGLRQTGKASGLPSG